MPPARRSTTKIKQVFTCLLGQVSRPNRSVIITKNGTDYDVSDDVIGDVQFSWNSVTSEIDSCSFVLDNRNGLYINL